jgi:O-antigen/teichoic acid export membrane protein
MRSIHMAPVWFAKLKARVYKSSLARQTLAYGVTNAITSGLGMMVGPILTHYLVPEDYGIATLFVAVFNFLAPLAGLGVQSAFRKRYFQKDEYHFASYVYSASLFCLGQVTVMTLLTLLTYPLWGWEKVSRLWALSFLPWIFGRYLMSVGTMLLQQAKRPLAFGVVNWVHTLINVVASLGLVIGLGLGWEGRVLGRIIAIFCVGIGSLWVIRGLMGPGARWSWPLAKDAVKFGLPAVPYALLNRAIEFGDRIVLGTFSGVEAVGLYTLGTQVAGLVGQVTQAFGLAFQPWLFEQLTNDDAKSKRRVTIVIYLAAGVLCLAALVLWGAVRWLFPIVIGDKYLTAMAYIPWLCGAAAMRGISMLFSSVILFSEKTTVLTRVAMMVGIAHLATAFGLIWVNGATGCAQANFLAGILNVVVLWAAARKLVPLPGL